MPNTPKPPNPEQRKPEIALARTDPARAQARDLRDQRVDHVVHLMAMGWWAGARSTRTLAEEWGISMHAVSEYAREASGIIRRLVDGDPNDVKAEILAGIAHIRELALAQTKFERTGPDSFEERHTPNVSAALQAYELRARLLGLFPREEIQVTVDAPDLSDLSEDELDAFVGVASKVKARSK
jgi:hypothetical protein